MNKNVILLICSVFLLACVTACTVTINQPGAGTANETAETGSTAKKSSAAESESSESATDKASDNNGSDKTSDSAEKKSDTPPDETEKPAESAAGEKSGNMGSLSNKLFGIFESGTYHMKTRMLSADGEILSDTYIKNGMVATAMETGDTIIRSVLRDGKSYTILDDQKTIMVFEISTDAVQDTPGVIDTANITYKGEGAAEFAGGTYKYEEYETDVGFLTQYFFDGENPKGFRTMAGDVSVDMIILALDKDVPDSVFEIPEGDDWTVIGY